MTDLEKYNLVNSCESIEELQAAVLKCGADGKIEGRTSTFDATKMSANVRYAILGDVNYNTLTRKWGIRQQALYIAHYNYSL